MKKTRRGGLGRGLGALIQSTADTEETTTSPSSSAPSDNSTQAASSEKKATTPRRRTTSAAAAASEKAADKAPAKETSKETAPKKSTTTRKSSTSAKSSTSKKPAASTASNGKTTVSGGKTPAKSTSTQTKKTASAGTSTGGGAKKTAGKGSSTAKTAGDDSSSKKTAAAGKASSGRSSRPVDVFFSSERTPAENEGEKAADTTSDSGEKDAKGSTSTPSRTAGARKAPARRSRPSMPAVSAPSRRSAAKATDADSTSENAAEGSAEAAAETTTTSQASETGTVSTDIAVLRELKVTDIHPNPRQPREVFDEDHMDELVTSITEVGILQPVVVREVDGPTPYELIMGERRWRATQLAGLDTIPAIVRHTPDEDLLRDALLENLHRSQLNPLEEAAAYQQLMDDFQCTQEELSQRIGRSRPQISNTLRLMKLPPLVQRRVANNTLTAGHARALLGLTDPAEMERLAQRIVSEGLSVRATEEAVALAQGVRQAAPATRRRGEPTRHERLDYFATALTSRLDTQVKITLGKRKGKIAIDFASVEDLNRIMELIQGDDDQK